MRVHLMPYGRALLAVLTIPSLAAAQGVWTSSQLYDRNYSQIASACNSYQPTVQGTSSTSVLCSYNGGSFSGAARATWGGELGSRASFDLNSGVALPAHNGVNMETRAVATDVLTANGAARAKLKVRLDGSIAIESDAASPSSEAFTSRMWLGVSGTGGTTVTSNGWNAYLAFTNSAKEQAGPVTYTGEFDGFPCGFCPGYNRVAHVDGMAIFNLALTNGRLPFALSLISEASIWNYTASANVSTGNSTTDFFSTAVLAGLELFDAAGNDITATTPYSFDSGAQVAIATAPEPASLTLMMTGLLGVLLARRRRAHRG